MNQRKLAASPLVLLVICFPSFWSAPALAATVEVVVTGTWRFETGADPSFDDPKNLDGAEVSYHFRYSDAQHSVGDDYLDGPGFCGGDHNVWCEFQASASLAFTNRPNGEAGVMGSFFGADATILHRLAATDVDQPFSAQFIVQRPESGIFNNIGYGSVEFEGFGPGLSRSINYALTADDYAAASLRLAPVILRGGSAYSYVLDDAQWSASTIVPLPPATIVFASGLFALGAYGRARHAR